MELDSTLGIAWTSNLSGEAPFPLSEQEVRGRFAPLRLRLRRDPVLAAPRISNLISLAPPRSGWFVSWRSFFSSSFFVFLSLQKDATLP